MPDRILGLDYGSKTVGVAVTDGLGLTAVSLETITRSKENHLRPTYRRIAEIADEYNVKLIVVGLPLNMDDSEGERAALARAFAGELTRRTGVRTVMQDERLTTVEASELISITGNHKKDPKAHIDAMAAAIILTDYLNQNGQNEHY